MTKYLIENIGQAEDHVKTTDGKSHKLAIGQSIIGEFDDDTVARMNHSVGLRVTKRHPSADVDPDDAPTAKAKAPKAKPEDSNTPPADAPPPSSIQADEKH